MVEPPDASEGSGRVPLRMVLRPGVFLTKRGIQLRPIIARLGRDVEVYLNDYEDYDDAYQHIGRFLDEVYMTKRVHSALGYLTPAEFEALHRVQSTG